MVKIISKTYQVCDMKNVTRRLRRQLSMHRLG